jgi:hypothetical protein
MKNKILDEEIKYEGPRICPECGYQFPFEEFVRRFIMAFGLSKWSCRGCGKVIKCGFIKLQILSLLGLVVAGVLFGLVSSYSDWALLNIAFLMLGFVLFLLPFYYVKFEKYDS